MTCFWAFGRLTGSRPLEGDGGNRGDKNEGKREDGWRTIFSGGRSGFRSPRQRDVEVLMAVKQSATAVPNDIMKGS